MNNQSRVQSRESRAGGRCPIVAPSTLDPRPSARAAFTLVEMLVVLVLLSLIVLALMAVFNSTQNAFRASLTQTDILESGRNAMDLMADDLRKMTPSYSVYSSNNIQQYAISESRFTNGPVNFYINSNPYNNLTPGYQPFVQYLPGTSAQRSNVLENFFMLSRQNVNGSPSWVGTGYMVDPSSQPTNSLYRFVMITNVMKGNPMMLFTNFYVTASQFAPGSPGNRKYNPFTNTANWTHLLDGVVDLRVRAYDPDGFRITNSMDVYNGQFIANQNTYMFLPTDLANLAVPAALKMYGCFMFSNAVPASVEVQMGVVEDTTLQRAEGLPNVPPAYAQTAYLSNHVGQVHLFRQRVLIPSVDPTAYQ